MFSLSYWFYSPAGAFDFLYFYLAAGLLLLIASLVSRYFLKKYKKNSILKKYLKPLPSGFFWFSVMTFLFIFLRYEKLYIFSARVWFVLILAAFLWWIIPKIKRFYTSYSCDQNSIEKGKYFHKYHPKRKK